ncbi:HAAS signaling domain-containing protein [Nocardioides zeae]|uniref:DUF1700 domain-containing protein n=1 Tax=Nocardioides zeae TaxID=1457234 RepID=A0A6P0HPM2_9ACTN|nr:hypothetical protein [Nocardioides zeae]NEN80260.1 hypothetical protein [Nocardioides zeae]
MSGEGKPVGLSADERVRRYLAEVDAALAARGVADRSEIVADLHEHVEAARAEGEDVTTLLAGLGDPQVIAAEAARDQPVGPAPYATAPVQPQRQPQGQPLRQPQRRAWPALVALGLVVLGSFLLGVVTQPVVPIAVIVLGWTGIWASPLWRTGEQFLGTIFVPAPGIVCAVALGVFAGGSETCETTSDGIDTQTVCTTADGGGSLLALLIGVPFIVLGLAYLVLLARLAVVRSRGA